MTAPPRRMRLSRRRGFSLEAESRALNGLPAKRVTRPGKWGNPFSASELAKAHGLDNASAQARAVALAADWLLGRIPPGSAPRPPERDEIRAALGGHNLACWCAPGTPCHADLLLALAIDPPSGEAG